MTIEKTHLPSRECGDLSRGCGMKGLPRLTNTEFNHVFYIENYNGNSRKI